jgi:hypothetical protein
MAKRKEPKRPKLYDATFKHLVDLRPRDILGYIRLMGEGPVRLADADLATVIPEADKVLMVGRGKSRFVVHVEFQTGNDRYLLRRAFS